MTKYTKIMTVKINIIETVYTLSKLFIYTYPCWFYYGEIQILLFAF